MITPNLNYSDHPYHKFKLPELNTVAALPEQFELLRKRLARQVLVALKCNSQ
jgi:hypothetical protein